MKNHFYKYSIEFFVIVFSISISFYLENLREEIEKENIRNLIKNSLLTELESEDGYIKGRIFAFNNDYNSLASVLDNNINIDSVFKYKSLAGFANPFFIARGFSPSSSIFSSLVNDGDINLIKSTKIKSLLQETYVHIPDGINFWIEDENDVAKRIENYIIDKYPNLYNKDVYTSDDKDIMREFIEMVKSDNKLKALIKSKRPAMVSKRNMIDSYVEKRESLILELKKSLDLLP